MNPELSRAANPIFSWEILVGVRDKTQISNGAFLYLREAGHRFAMSCFRACLRESHSYGVCCTRGLTIAETSLIHEFS